MRTGTIIYAVSLILVFCSTCGSAYAQTEEIESQKRLIRELENDISYLDNQIQSTQRQKKNTLDELVLIQRKISSRKKLLAGIDAEIKANTREINNTSNNIRSLEMRLDTLEHYYRNMVYNAYKHRDTKLWFMYILASNSFEQGYRRWSYLKNYSRTINTQAEKIRDLRQERTAALEKLKKLRSSNLAAQASRTEEYKKLTTEEKQGKAFAQSLDKKQSQFKSQLAQKRKEAARLAKEVERLIAEEIKRQQELARRQAEMKQNAGRDTQKSATAKENGIISLELQEYANNTKLSGSFAINRGRLPFPVSSGVIVEQFGEHPHPTLKNVKLPFNNGINISTRPGATVMAVFDGVVKQVIAIPGYNQCVLVQHGQYFTFYCKLAKVNVKVGDKLSTGEAIGSLETHSSTATLHFELWNGTTKQNPEFWLKK